jgi:large subunit ribosomal protein L4
MKYIVLDKTGSRSAERELPAELAVKEISFPLIHEVVEIERTNRRQGTHATKTKAMVSGGGKKPWRQKGTGSARQGSIRNPQFRGGGVAHGPQPVDYTKRIPRAKRRNGLKHIVAHKANMQSLFVVEGWSLEDYSTKAAYELLKKASILPSETVCFVYADGDRFVESSVRNIQLVQAMNVRRLQATELYYNSALVMTGDAFQALAASFK